MPYIKLQIVEGRELNIKRKLVSSVTKAVCEAIDTTPDNVRIELIELKKENFSIEGKLMIDR